MARATRPIPEGYRTVTPYLVVSDAAGAIEFYTRAFGARELSRSPGPDGKSIINAEIEIGDSRLFLMDEAPAMGAKSPLALGGSPVTLYLYVEDADDAFDRAVKAGAKVGAPVTDQFWGDRWGWVTDPFGHSWHIATHMEDLTPEEIAQRMAEASKAYAG